MLGQRVSNEQSNVGPTIYVAVGPTLHQRLGFGWRMVSVLAGLTESVDDRGDYNLFWNCSIDIVVCSVDPH